MSAMANFITNLSGWTPQMYWDLTWEERDAIVRELNRQADIRKKR